MLNQAILEAGHRPQKAGTNSLRMADVSWKSLQSFRVFLIAVVATFFVNHWEIDLWMTSLFRDQKLSIWTWEDLFLWKLVFNCAHIPAVLLVVHGGFWALVGLSRRRFDERAKLGWFLVLGLALGPGLIVNGILKETVGRPRPHQIIDYGGRNHFAAVGTLGEIPRNSSFPCGHASMGFYLMLPGLLLARRHKNRAAARWLILGLGTGGLIGLSRIVQGDHFLSDVLWSGVVIYYTGVILAKFTDLVDEQFQQHRNQQRAETNALLRSVKESDSSDYVEGGVSQTELHPMQRDAGSPSR